MAPNPTIASLNRLTQLILSSERKENIPTTLKKNLQSIIFFPPQSEPSYRETHERWNCVLERLRIENHQVVALEIEKRYAEVQDMAKTDDTQLVALHSTDFHT